MDALGNPGWDPMVFASDAAFLYYLPALIRLAFEADYSEQLLFNLDVPGRLDALTQAQAEALLAALWLLAEVKEEDIFNDFDDHTLGRVLGKLESRQGQA